MKVHLVCGYKRSGKDTFYKSLQNGTLKNINPGEKIALEIEDNQIKIINADHVIDEMHRIFTKNQMSKKDSHVDDFINQKHEEYNIEKSRDQKNV